MNKKKIFKSVAMSTLALTAILKGPLAVAANESAIQIETYLNSSSATPNGVASLGNGPASITVTGNASQTLVGKQFQVLQLFTAQNAAGGESINYSWNPEYKVALQNVVGAALNKTPSSVTEYMVIDYIQSLNTNPVEGANANQTLEGSYSDLRYFVQDVRNEIVNLGLKGSVVNVTATKADNSITIGGLDYGYYIVDEINVGNNNEHSAASLCMVTTANPNASMNIKSDYPELEKKIDEDDNGIGWNDIGDYEIGQTVPYRYRTAVPNMNGYHSYYLAFQDKMDPCLTFDPSSVQITISDGNKTYTLANSEFTVAENVKGLTFEVAIANLKAIVDREFPAGINANGENTYGQNIEVTYNATLNDKAADQTGRPGFENTVRLEFSNNPDSDGTGDTGFTPWDTVVAFTYKIDGLKINNHDKVLEGAKFRLYSDADCQNEVFLKKGANGYIVINRDSVGGDDHTGGSRPADAVEMVSDAAGKFVIFGLDQGTYWLKETQAPDGYRPLLDPIQITITPTFTTDRDGYIDGQGATDAILKDLQAIATTKQFLGGADNTKTENLVTDVATGTANLTVVNHVGSKLPVTGSNATIIMLAAGAVIGGAGLYMNRKSKKSDNNKEEE